MKLIRLAFFCSFLLVSLSIASAKIIPNAYIVQVDESVDIQQAAEATEFATGGTVSHTYSYALRGFAIQFPDLPEQAADAAYKALLNRPGVVLVEPDLVTTTASQTIPRGVQRINAHNCKIANINEVDQRIDVDVAVIDSGIFKDHPDLNIAGGTSFLTGSPHAWSDGDGHGTHVAGTIGALDNDFGVVGVAPGVRLWAIRVIQGSSGSTSDLIKGIDWVTANADKISVANISLSAQGVSSSLRSAIQNSVAAGVVYFAAAGNNGEDIFGETGSYYHADNYLPAAYPEVATISALRDNDGKPGGLGGSLDDSFWANSNFSETDPPNNPVVSPGRGIDLMMPGYSIYSTNINNGYTTKSGTSMASPHAAGLAALYIAVNGRAYDAAGVYAIRQALIDSGVDQDSSRGLAVLNDKDDYPERIGYITVGDFNYDSWVDLSDLELLAWNWLSSEEDLNFCRICDLTADGVINMFDMAEFANSWLDGLE